MGDGPAVDFSFTNNCSVGSTVQFTSSVIGTGIDSYLWDFGDGSGSSMLENPTYSYGSAGTYTASLTVTNDDGCSTTTTSDITVTDDPRVLMILPATSENVETTFLANDLIVEDPAVSWSWTFDVLGSDSDQNPSFTFPSPGDYSIDLEVTTSQGCVYNLMETLTVTEAECATASFTTISSVCLSESLDISNTSVNSESYSWDFCVGDLGETPTAENILTDASLGLASQLAVVEDGGNFYGFSVDRGTGKLFRWDYGTSLDEALPTLVDMGVIDASISETFAIEMVKEDGTWYAFVTDASGVGLYRWTFNTGLTSSDITSEEIVLPAGYLTGPRSLEIVDQGSNKLVVVGNLANPGTLARVSFDSFAGDTTSTASIAVTGSDGVADVAITYDCPDWHGIVSSLSNNKVFHLAFGSDLTQSPTVNELTTASVALPAGVELEMEAGERYGFVQEFGSGDLVRLTFDSDWTLSTSGVLVNSGTTSTWGIKLVKDSSAWRGFTIGLNDRVERYTFPESCATTTPISTDETPLGIFYTSDGVYDIQLTATDSDGNYIQSTQSVTVLSNTAPDASFAVTDERCIDASSTFSANTLGMSYSWDFNGEGVGSTQEEAFQFPTSGEKTVTLTVTMGLVRIVHRWISPFTRM